VPRVKVFSHGSTPPVENEVAGIKAQSDDGIDRSSKQVSGTGGSVKPGTSTTDDRQSPGSPSRRGHGALLKSSDSAAGRYRGPGESKDNGGGVRSGNTTQFREDVNRHNQDRILHSSMSLCEAPIQAKQQAAAADEAQTDMMLQSNDKDQQAELSPKLPPAKLHKIKPEVHGAYRGPHETLHGTITNTSKDCAHLTVAYNGMQLDDKEVGDQLDGTQTESKTFEK